MPLTRSPGRNRHGENWIVQYRSSEAVPVVGTGVRLDELHRRRGHKARRDKPNRRVAAGPKPDRVHGVAKGSPAPRRGCAALRRLSARWLRSDPTGVSDRRRVALVRRALQVEIARSAAEASARNQRKWPAMWGLSAPSPLAHRTRSGAQSATLWTVWGGRRRGAVYGGYWQGHNR